MRLAATPKMFLFLKSTAGNRAHETIGRNAIQWAKNPKNLQKLQMTIIMKNLHFASKAPKLFKNFELSFWLFGSVCAALCYHLHHPNWRRRCHSCTKLKGKMTLQKNPSNATTRKRKFQEQSENQASTTSSQTTNRQQMQIQTEFQILQSLIPGIANQVDISEVCAYL